MTVLITGAAGFIGSHLVETLLEREESVVGIDNYDPYYDPAIKRNNLEPSLSDPHFTFAEGDIRDGDMVEQLFEKHDIEKVVHLAARAGVRPSVEDPQVYEEVNVRGTLNLLERSENYNVNGFIYGSSSSVYGSTEEVPFGEGGPKNPISPYAASKLSAEVFCETYSRLHDLNVTILRFFTVYGPRQRPEMAIHKFTRLIERGEKIPMYGDGSSKRDYTYIEDIVAGITSALDRDFDCETFNLGNNTTVELRELISIIEEKTGKKAEIDRHPMPKGDMQVTCANIAKARRSLNYRPEVPIDVGVEKFVNWYRENRTLLEKVG